MWVEHSTAYKWQTFAEMGVVTSRDPVWIFSPLRYIWNDFRDFKFGVHVDHSMSQQIVPERSVVRSCDPLNFLGAPVISLERLNLNSSNFFHRWVISILVTSHLRSLSLITRLLWRTVSKFIIDWLIESNTVYVIRPNMSVASYSNNNPNLCYTSLCWLKHKTCVSLTQDKLC